MLNRLLSRIAINPSTIDQLSFYGQRLKKEQSIRRLGLFFIILSMFVQIFAAMVPAEKSLASSDNHLINGIKTRQDILRAWDRSGSDIPTIYAKFGVTRQDIANLPSKPNATIRSNASKNYWSVGRNSLSGYGDIKQKYKNQEVALQTDGPTIYMRPLHAWDTNKNYSSYKAFKGINSSTGKAFWILVDCGNYMQVGKLVKKDKPKKPILEVRKTIVSKTTQLKPGDTLRFKIEYRNKGKDSLAEDVKIEDQLDTKSFDVISPKNSSISVGGKLTRNVGNLKFSNTRRVFNLTVRLKENLPGGTTICNSVRLVASNAPSVTAGGSPGTCVEIVKENVETASCELTSSIIDRKKKKIDLDTVTTVSDTRKVNILSYDYDFGDGTQESDTTTSRRDSQSHTYKDGTFLAKVTVNYEIEGKKGTSQQSACTAPIEVAGIIIVDPLEKAPVGLSKEVRNITRGLSDEASQNSSVRAGDVLEYTLITSNSQSFAVKNYNVTDYVGDITDYADINTASISPSGGQYNQNTKRITWENQNLPPKSETSHVFRVTMKNPIPSTNAPSNLSTNFDCKISNQYGEEISINVECPVLKKVEELPNTGPGTAVAIVFVLSVVSGYFFARARLLAKEVGIIKKTYQRAD